MIQCKARALRRAVPGLRLHGPAGGPGAVLLLFFVCVLLESSCVLLLVVLL